MGLYFWLLCRLIASQTSAAGSTEIPASSFYWILCKDTRMLSAEGKLALYPWLLFRSCNSKLKSPSGKMGQETTFST